MKWNVKLTTDALKQLQNITDKRVRSNLFERIEELSNEPEKQGKPLRNELSGLRCVRAIGQRYRILFKVVRDQVVVVVVAIGQRKEGDRADIYQIAARLMRSGLLSFPDDDPRAE